MHLVPGRGIPRCALLRFLAYCRRVQGWRALHKTVQSHGPLYHRPALAGPGAWWCRTCRRHCPDAACERVLASPGQQEGTGLGQGSHSVGTGQVAALEGSATSCARLLASFEARQGKRDVCGSRRQVEERGVCRPVWQPSGSRAEKSSPAGGLTQWLHHGVDAEGWPGIGAGMLREKVSTERVGPTATVQEARRGSPVRPTAEASTTRAHAWPCTHKMVTTTTVCKLHEHGPRNCIPPTDRRQAEAKTAMQRAHRGPHRG